MSYYAEYTIHGTDSVTVVTDDTCSSKCSAHGVLETVKSAEYAFPATHVERVARLHHIESH